MQEKLDKIEKMETIIDTDYSNMAGIVVMKDGKAVYENYFHGCTQANRFNIFQQPKVSFLYYWGLRSTKGISMALTGKYWTFIRNILLREAKRQYRISRSETCLP